MENMAPILDWLRSIESPCKIEESKYRAGLALLAKSIRKRFVPRLSRPPFHRQKCRMLYVQLRYVAGKAMPTPVSTTPLAMPRPASGAGTLPVQPPEKPEVYVTPWSELRVSRVDWELLPDVLKQEYFRKGKLFSEAAAAQRRLALANAGKDPRDISPEQQQENARWAETVLRNFSDINAIWERIDYYRANGRLMPETLPSRPAPVELDTVEKVNKRLRVRRNNLRTYRERLAGTEREDRKARLQLRIEELQAEIEALKQQRENLKHGKG